MKRPFDYDRLSRMGGLTVLAFALALAACAPAATPTPTAAPRPAIQPSPTPAVPPTSTPQKPKYGGVLTMALVADPPSLDPFAETTANIGDPASVILDTLVARDPYDPSLRYVPRLAEKWFLSGDGLTISYNLRRDVKFQDGTPMTAADVKYTVERYAKPPQGVRSTQIAALEPVASVEAPDNYTVVFRIKRVFVPMLERLHGHAPYSKKWLEAGNDPRTAMMGTGPFKFKAFTPGISVEFVRSDNFWQAGKPYLDGVTYYVLKDPGTRFAALRTGQVKVLGNYFSAIPPSDKETLDKERSPIRLWPMQTQLGPWVVFRLTEKPWDDVRVRKAVNLAVDRWQAIAVVFQGAGRVGTHLTYRDPPGIPYEELITLPGYRKDKTQDLAEAKRLMAEAGYAGGVQVKFTSRTIKSFQDEALYTADQMSKIGISATLEVVEDSAFFPQARQGKFSVMQFNTTSGGFDPYDALSSWLGKSGSLNFHVYEAPDWLAQFEAMGSELDPKKRQQLVREIDKRITFDEVPGVFLGWLYNYNAAWPQVRNYPQGAPDSSRGIMENVWLAD